LSYIPANFLFYSPLTVNLPANGGTLSQLSYIPANFL